MKIAGLSLIDIGCGGPTWRRRLPGIGIAAAALMICCGHTIAADAPAAAGTNAGTSAAATAGSSPDANSTEGSAADAGGPVDLSRVVSINFKEMAIVDALRYLADTAHTNIVASAGITGAVSLKLQKVSLATVLGYITQSNKLDYFVDQPNHTIIVGTASDIKRYRVTPSGPIVVTLAHVPSDQIASAITKNFQDVEAMPEGTNKLLISGPVDDVDAAKQLIAALDVAPPAPPTPPTPPSEAPPPTVQAVLNLKSASPSDVVSAFTRLYPKLIAVSQGKSQIVLSGEEGDVQSAAVLLQKMDVAPVNAASNTKTITYFSHFADVGELQRILTARVPDVLAIPGPAPAFLGGGGGGSASSGSAGGGNSTGGGGSGGGSGGGGSEGGGGMGPSGGSSAGGSSSGSGGGSGGSGAGGLAMRTSLLLLTGTTENLDSALSVLAQVDVQPAQVLIETKVIDVNMDYEETVGINWNLSAIPFGEVTPNTTGTTTTTGAATTINVPTLASGTSTVPGASIFPFTSPGLARGLITPTLDLLANDDHNKVLASPKILALSDRPADIFIGDEIHYVSQIDRTATGTNITTETQNVGIDLSMVSHVEPDGQITLRVSPDVSALTSLVTSADGSQLPLISKRSATTTMRLTSGQTICIGGLIQDEDLKSTSKVPFLGDLPFFGQIFRHRQITKSRDEVMIFITATIQPQTAP